MVLMDALPSLGIPGNLQYLSWGSYGQDGARAPVPEGLPVLHQHAVGLGVNL
jgi:hypothetical protein